MRRLLLILMFGILSFTAAAQLSPTYDDLKESFDAFAQGVASTLPYNSLVGLNWSDAHIKNFPHFGIGITAGATVMPYINLEETFTLLGIDPAHLQNPDIAALLEDFGMPFPAVSLEARLGGFILPFDMGIKVGWVPEDFELSIITDGFALNYFSIGGDIRFRLLKQWFMVPGICVGSGLTYQQGSIDIPGILGENLVLTGVGAFNLEMKDPSLNFNWSTFVADIKAQASWDLFLMTPYIGTGASYSFNAEAGGGIKTEILDSATGEPITQDQIDLIIDNFEALGLEPPDLTDTQILVSSSSPSAWAYRIYGGISVNFFVLRLDATIMYNFLSEGLGGSINARVQF